MDTATAVVQLLLRLAKTGYRGAIKPHALTALAANAVEHGVDEVMRGIMTDPGLLIAPNCRWTVYRVGISAFGPDPPYLKHGVFHTPRTSKELRQAIREDGLSVDIMKRGPRYYWVWGTHSLDAEARALYNYTLENWVLEARKAERLLRDVSWDERIGQEPVAWTH